jgi:hypothetical protein
MFVGMDLHRSYLLVAVLDEKGKVLDNSRVDDNLTKVALVISFVETILENISLLTES